MADNPVILASGSSSVGPGTIIIGVIVIGGVAYLLLSKTSIGNLLDLPTKAYDDVTDAAKYVGGATKRTWERTKRNAGRFGRTVGRQPKNLGRKIKNIFR